MQTLLTDWLQLHAPAFYGLLALTLLIGCGLLLNTQRARPAPRAAPRLYVPAMIPTVEQIIVSGQLPEGVDTPTLEATSAQLARILQEAPIHEWGLIGEEFKGRCQRLASTVQQALNRRRGADGMTPLTQ